MESNTSSAVINVSIFREIGKIVETYETHQVTDTEGIDTDTIVHSVTRS